MPPLLLLCLAWLAGLALARLPEPAVGLLWLGVAAGLLLLYRPRGPLPWPLVMLALVVAGLGLWRGLPPPAEALPTLPSGVTAARGTVATWPRRLESVTLVHLTVTEVEQQGVWRPVGAALEARLPLYPEVGLGDAIEAVGPTRPLADVSDRRAAEALRRDGLAGQLWARRVTVLADRPPTGLAAWREGATRAVTAALDRALPIPVAGLAAGVLIGDRRGLPAEARAAFIATGTVHLLVVSGWNMTLVIALVGWIGARLRARHHPVWLPLALLGIAGYTLLVGAEPSVVRAALMGGLTVLALALGRGSDPLVALAVAAAVMAGLSPALLVDLGFQLSFLATLGLLVALPPLLPRLATWPWPARLVAEPLAATLAAQLAVEPLLAYTFGRVSLIAPLVNLLVVPLVPVVMAGALLVVGFSLAPGLPPLADLAAWLTTLAATPLLAVVTTGARLPFASLAVPAPPAPLVGLLYAGLALVALALLTPEPAATARRALGLLRPAAPALGLLGLATAAGLVWLALLG